MEGSVSLRPIIPTPPRVAPPATGRPVVANQAVAPAYTATVNSQTTATPTLPLVPSGITGMLAPPASGPIAMPSQSPAEELLNFFRRLFPEGDFSSEHGSLGEWLQTQIDAGNNAHPPREASFDLSDPKFKAGLALALHCTSDVIYDVALNALFGNQSRDGRLDSHDTRTFAELRSRLQFMVPHFEVQREMGGSGAAAVLRTEYVFIVENSALVDQAFSGNMSYQFQNPIFKEAVRAAANRYLTEHQGSESDAESRVVREFAEDVSRGRGNGIIPSSIRHLVTAALWGRFERALAERRVDLTCLEGHPERNRQFMGGMFLDYALGRHYTPDATNNRFDSILPERRHDVTPREITESFNYWSQRIPLTRPNLVALPASVANPPSVSNVR